MTTYQSEEEAREAGISFEHEPDRQRFVVVRATEGHERDLVGEAHYTLLGAEGINFDHTFITPALRGTGLSDLLAEHALTDDLVRGRKIHASCWFIAEYLAKHPHLSNTN